MPGTSPASPAAPQLRSELRPSYSACRPSPRRSGNRAYFCATLVKNVIIPQSGASWRKLRCATAETLTIATTRPRGVGDDVVSRVADSRTCHAAAEMPGEPAGAMWQQSRSTHLPGKTANVRTMAAHRPVSGNGSVEWKGPTSPNPARAKRRVVVRRPPLLDANDTTLLRLKNPEPPNFPVTINEVASSSLKFQ
jgi:hypothetical protein